MRTPIALLLSLLALTTTALAEGPVIEQSAKRQRQLAVTFSPIHLILPLVEVTVELRVADKLGLAGILAGGTVDVKTDKVTTDKFTAYEVGAQLRYYLLGSFEHGMQLGAEVLYLGVSSDDVAGGNVSADGAGLAAGPFLGYKYTSDIGFTFDCQLGVEKLLISAEAKSGAVEAKEEEDVVIPLLNLNVGWSF